MTRHRRIRVLSLVLAAAAAWMFAPAPAEAHPKHERDRYERHDRDHGRWDRGKRHEQRYDRWERRHERRYDRWDRRHDRHHARRGHWGPYRPAPFFCRDHRVSFGHQGAYRRHLIHVHHVPFWRLPRVALHLDF